MLHDDWQKRLSRLDATKAANTDRRLFHDLNPNAEHSPIFKKALSEMRPASVMIPIMMRADGPHVLFTVRTSGMPSHAGEISLPGGGPKGCDGCPEDTALRETSEEVGIISTEIEILARMGVHYGGLGFAVTPIVGLIKSPSVLTPSPREVSEIFEVPLRTIVSRDRHIIEDRHFGEHRYKMFAFPWQEGTPSRHIWGLTAGILDTFALAYHDLPVYDG